MDTPASASDPMVAKLASGSYGDLWNYAVRDSVVDAIWAEPDSLRRLEAIASDGGAPLAARFVACEVLYEREFTFLGVVGRERVAGIYVAAFQQNLTGMANSWGLLYEGDDYGPAGARLVGLGAAAIPALLPLLHDDHPGPIYAGSEEATVGNARGYRVKDYAAFYLSKIAKIPVPWHDAPAERDAEIARLEQALQAR